MTLNSYIFIMAFMPVFILLYFLAGKLGGKAAKAVLILGSAVFYAYGGWQTTAILALSMAVNLGLAFYAQKNRNRRLPVVLTGVLNVGLLLYFKYLNFAIDSINTFRSDPLPNAEIILPLGISFFTFQQIMYVVSVWKGEIGAVNVPDYLVYILYFPKLVMGPLTEPADLIRQINDESGRRVNWDNIASGLKIFSLGLFKKMLLADTFAEAVNWGFTYGVTTERAPIATSGELFLVMLFYTFQIYFDFSGYSDMAVGVSQMLNITLPINFDSPYKATSIRDFWKRWHMTLTGFLTKYVYFPLGGSRKGAVRTYVNIMIVFLVSGIWHGANWTFILWGALHGLFQVLERRFNNVFQKLSETVRWFYTFFVVNVLWLLFRSDSIGHWIEMLTTMFKFESMALGDDLVNTFVRPECAFLYDLLHLNHLDLEVRGFTMLLFIAAAFIICLIPENNYKKRGKINWFNMAVCAAALLWGILCMSSDSTFIYSNF